MVPIVFITRLDGGGMETFCLNLFRAWSFSGIKATLYSSFAGGVRNNEFPNGLERVCWNLRARNSFWKLAKWLRTRPDDPCLVLSQEVAAVLLVLKKLRLIKNRIYFRESTDVERHYSRGFKRIMRWLWPALDGIVEQSQVGMDKTRRICNGRFPKSILIRNIQSQPEIDSQFSLQGKCVRLACIGSFKSMKGQRFLVEQLSSDVSSDWSLEFCGDGERRAEIEVLVEKYALSGRISFCDWTADVGRAYKNCDIVVIPSDYEGLPNVMLEAILSGKRVSVRPTCTGACELLNEIGIGEIWPWQKALEISQQAWEEARNKLAVLTNPATNANALLEFMKCPSAEEKRRFE